VISGIDVNDVFTFSQFLSATIGPSVALVSAPKIIPSSNIHPTMVVPVDVALGRGIPLDARKLFLQGQISKSLQVLTVY
jgi:hypothetical protein